MDHCTTKTVYGFQTPLKTPDRLEAEKAAIVYSFKVINWIVNHFFISWLHHEGRKIHKIYPAWIHQKWCSHWPWWQVTPALMLNSFIFQKTQSDPKRSTQLPSPLYFFLQLCTWGPASYNWNLLTTIPRFHFFSGCERCHPEISQVEKKCLFWGPPNYVIFT